MKKIIKYSLITLLFTNSLFADTPISSVDIEANKLNQLLKKEIELVNMVESYLLLKTPNLNNKLDYSQVTRSEIQKFYNLPNSYFTNYSNESCITGSDNLCDNNPQGINISIDIDKKILTINNLLGITSINDQNKNIFKRLHKKYKNVIFMNKFDVNGGIDRQLSNKVLKLEKNLNTYFQNPYQNATLNYLKPIYNVTTGLPKVWVKPDGEGGFYSYTYDTMLQDWKLIGKNIVIKNPTFGKYSDLQNVKSFDGAIMYARYSNNDSKYSKNGELEFINTGNLSSTKDMWSIKAGNNVFITESTTINNKCSEIKNALIGSDANDRYIYKNGYSGKTIESELNITSNGSETIINAEQLFYKFRTNYSFKFDPNKPMTDKNILSLNYENSNDLVFYSNNSGNPKILSNNMLSFEVFNKNSGKLDVIKKIVINRVDIFDYSSRTWFSFTPLQPNNVLNYNGVDSLRNIKLILDANAEAKLNILFMNKYKPSVLSSGTISEKNIDTIEFDISKNFVDFYDDIETDVYDGNFDTTPGYPIVIDFSITVDSKCDNGRNFHDCYLVQTGNKGCYISNTTVSKEPVQ